MSSARKCGTCTLCCTLVPVEAGIMEAGTGKLLARTFHKPAGQKCPHCRFQKGCSIYERRPLGCRDWSCFWLQDPDGTAGLRRPDRAGYVIDTTPDCIIYVNPDDGSRTEIMALQVWVDPKRPDAHEDPALRALLNGLCCPAIVRFNERDGFSLWPPSVTGGDSWVIQYADTILERSHNEYIEWVAKTLVETGAVEEVA